MSSLLRTPLYPLYSDFPSVRCIDFGGWELPVQFTGIVQEHEAVRKHAGLFDVSHMGEFFVAGPDTEAFLQKMTTNDVTRLSVGQAQYTLLCNDNGGVVDDLLVYKLADARYMLVVNASNIDKDFAWLQDHRFGDIELRNISAETALIALQGPAAEAIISAAVPEAETLQSLPSFHFIQDVHVFGSKALVSRTGYTGEDGYEIYCTANEAPAIWRGLLDTGRTHGLVPAGLGARDTLRFEAKLPLYGQELSADISPLEAGLGFFVKLDKGDFIGREELIRQKTEGVARKLVGIEMIDRGIPRSHYTVHDQNGDPIGEVTSGTQSPTLKRSLGLALIDSAHAALGSEVWVEIRGKKLKAKVAKTPFYKRGAALT